MRLKKYLIGIGLITISPIIAVLVRMSFLQLVGYDVDKDPKDLAQEIYDDGDSATRCMKLQRSLPTMGPTLADQRSRCVLEYADMAKDPKACELIMLGRYRLACVGYAKEIDYPCYISSNSVVRGSGISTTIDECFNGPWHIRNNACCIIARISKDSGYEDCAGLGDVSLWNQCQEKLAFERRDISYCEAISVENSRVACEVITKAIRDDPSIIK